MKISTQTQITEFIQEAAPDLQNMVETMSVEEMADYFVEKGIFKSKTDIKYFLFDAVPFMVFNKETSLDLPVHYYSEEEEIEESIEIPENDNIIDFIKRSQELR